MSEPVFAGAEGSEPSIVSPDETSPDLAAVAGLEGLERLESLERLEDEDDLGVTDEVPVPFHIVDPTVREAIPPQVLGSVAPIALDVAPPIPRGRGATTTLGTLAMPSQAPLGPGAVLAIVSSLAVLAIGVGALFSFGPWSQRPSPAAAPTHAAPRAADIQTPRGIHYRP